MKNATQLLAALAVLWIASAGCAAGTLSGAGGASGTSGTGSTSADTTAGAGGSGGAASTTAGTGGGSPCNPATCANGCCSNDLCMAGTSDTSCGKGAAACEDCAATGHPCIDKVCAQVAKCDAVSCPGGCCLGGDSCELGLSDQACGKGGVACVNCSSQGQACVNGSCGN